MKVKAIAVGYYDLKRRHPGVEFTLLNEGEFSWRWMLPVGWKPKKEKPDDYEEILERSKDDVPVVLSKKSARIKAEIQAQS